MDGLLGLLNALFITEARCSYSADIDRVNQMGRIGAGAGDHENASVCIYTSPPNNMKPFL